MVTEKENYLLDPPTRSQCLALFSRYDMLPNIRAHSLKVCQVSLSISKAIDRAGYPVDIRLVEAGALLHDITKTQSLGKKENHAQTGRDLLLALGFPQTAKVVGEHIIPIDRGEILTASEIVAYADKRVLHDRIVLLTERFEYLERTYGHFDGAASYHQKMKKKMNFIEEMIVNITAKSLDVLIPVDR